MTTTATQERPILFSCEMVRAILADRKTQTRRVVKPQPPSLESVQSISGTGYHWMPPENGFDSWRVAGPVWAVRKLMGLEPHLKCPYGQLGHRLWVRERWAAVQERDHLPPSKLSFENTNIFYDRGSVGVYDCRGTSTGAYKKGVWRPSIHMPRKFSRINLEVTGVRVERLHEITADDIRAEGFSIPSHDCFPDVNTRSKLVFQFRKTWDAINANRCYSWESNPFVWVVEFKRIEKGTPCSPP